MKKKKNEIEAITQYIQQTYGEVKPEWELLINLLADNIEQYKAVQVELNKTGLFNPDTYKKNPLLATLKDLQATMLKQIQHLGISPYASGKIKQTPDDDSGDFIKNLING